MGGALELGPICPEAWGPERSRRMAEQYTRVGLERHGQKSIFRQTAGTMWGGEIDGVLGYLQAPRPKSIMLC